MTMLLALLLSIFRLTGFFTEPRLGSEEIHAVKGGRSRVMWPSAADRPVRIVTWNIERGVKFDAIASLLEELDADIVLLQEVDRFCSRSGYRDVANDLAVTLRMNWISAGEFQEIGEGRRGSPCISGQAILSRRAIDAAVVLRFGEQATLKWRMNPAQPRRGARIALRASIGGMTIYNLHLESGSNEQRRSIQIKEVVTDARSVHSPIVVGGDFNNAGRSDSFMFDALAVGGFTNTMNLDRQTARRPIDWIFTKDLNGTAAPVRAPDASDHDPVIMCAETTHAFPR